MQTRLHPLLAPTKTNLPVQYLSCNMLMDMVEKCVRYHTNCTIAAALHPTQRPSSAGFSRCEAGYVVGAGCTEGHS